MPIDYSKWDALELSDDSDIEVHPNVDKRSFIRAKQNQIHAEREQRKNQIETLKYERIINDALIKRISSLLASLRSHAAEAESRNPGEVAFRAVMETAASLDPKDDQPPPRPAGVHNAEESLPTYTKMITTLLDQVDKALDEKKVDQDKRYGAMVAEVADHLEKVTTLQADLHKKLAELEKLEKSKITSESIHTGFDSSHINKSTSAGDKGYSKPELLNPNFAGTPSVPAPPSAPGAADDGDDDDDDDDMEASPTDKQFAQIKASEQRQSLSFLSAHPEILTEKDTDAILMLAFNSQLEGRDDYARNCVHQALLLQYCRALGRDGVALFFKRIMTPNHQAQGIFFKDVQETYLRIKTRTREISLQRAKDEAAGTAAVEQIQLHAVEPGTVINIKIPAKDSEDPAEKAGREIFESFTPEMQAALETGTLDEVNKAIGKLAVGEAEELVAKLGEAGILSIEEEIIDATTEDGQKKLKTLEEEAHRTEAQGTQAQETEDPNLKGVENHGTLQYRLKPCLGSCHGDDSSSTPRTRLREIIVEASAGDQGERRYPAEVNAARRVSYCGFNRSLTRKNPERNAHMEKEYQKD
ncbi:Cdc37 N terminal kinase binding-domain-containing protein [Lasiosphaeria miniovina]|uniref:Hsp90 chaperone protein kinase-targeting subunit n=1 Tax=Lasiosphaeria miniovina TaxID=1954250 RepID=A0AA40E0T0_9PEZI|nr:Cdc37 N terminal kinase binding-domain-containing protein [Lasiosphaeria miniovina]KAK0722780.1 Cdc37 N terminal kinase binding-domain-containing protein [Lasiosphaeria miniovina]